MKIKNFALLSLICFITSFVYLNTGCDSDPTVNGGDGTNPVITHTPLTNQTKNTWPTTVSAEVTDNEGIQSVWVNWYINTQVTIYQFYLYNTSGNNYSAAFNSDTSQVQVNDIIYYKISSPLSLPSRCQAGNM